MKRIAFWFENNLISNVDMTFPIEGNPGVGGTEYQFVLLAHMLQTVKSDEIEIYFLVEKIQSIPSSIKQIQVSNFAGAYDLSAELGIDFLIFRPRRNITSEVELIQFKGTKLIPWLHITPKREYLDWFVHNPLIHHVVFVGDDQRMRTIDHDVFSISSTIFNSSNGNYRMTSSRHDKTVVYVGALVPRKGFHVLARAWKDVRKRIPTAQLFVVGSGSLYDEDASLGPLGLAEENYEVRFVELLGGETGIRENQVHFLGNLGSNKKEIIESAVVGVVNPSGLTENCPMSVVEFYQSGIPVVSSRKYGMRDMIIQNKTGILCRSHKDLSSSIVKILNGSIDCDYLGSNAIEFAQYKFSPEKILDEWLRIFSCEFQQGQHIKGYWVHRLFFILKYFQILPKKWPMTEDLKINVSNLRGKILFKLR